MSPLPDSTSRSEEEMPGVSLGDGATDHDVDFKNANNKPRGYDPDELQARLKPHLDPKFAMGLPNLGITVLFCLLFFVFSYLGLRPLDLYTHVNYGEWILTNGALPQTDPFLKFAAGMPVDNSSWLSQVIAAGVYRLGGGEALSSLFSAMKVAVFLVFGIVIFLRTRSLTFVAGAVILLGLAFGVRMLDSPIDIFGQLAFMTLLLLVTREDLRTQARTSPTAEDGARSSTFLSDNLSWFAIPALFVLWVNLHVSFVFGLTLLFAWAVGRTWDAWRKQGSLSAALADSQVRRRFWLMELAIAATLVNPQLLGAWRQAFQTAVNANLRDQVQYAWLSFSGYSGLVLAVAILLMMFLLRKGKEVGGFEILGFVTLAVAASMTVYAVPLFGAAMLVLASGHLARLCCCGAPCDMDNASKADLTKRAARGELPADAQLAMEDDEELTLPPGRSFIYSLLCLLMIWLAIMFTPTYDLFASPKEKQRSPAQLLGEDAPWRVAAYLQENPLEDAVYAPYSWAGYFQATIMPASDKTEGETISSRYFANAMVNNLPRSVWQDYMTLSGAGRNWGETMDRYDIRHAIVDKTSQSALARAIRGSDEWRIRYEDEFAIVASRAFRTAPTNSDSEENPALSGEDAAKDQSGRGQSSGVSPGTPLDLVP